MSNIVSFEFLIFISIVTFIYYLFPKKNQWLILLGFSLIFYFSQSLIYYIVITTISTYILSLIISKSNNQKKNKLLVFLGIFINLFFLIVLKYDLFTYISDSFSLIMPLGISYYTLSSIAYLVDTYRQKINPDGFFHFFLGISFFPTLIQGPITCYKDVKESLFTPHHFDRQKFVDGSLRILWGFFKKLVIAARLTLITTYIVDNNVGSFYVIIALLLYGIEIYTDFSAGIDIVLGFAKILQIDLPENFNAPYFSKNLNEFWKRWHISLTSWYRNYVYITLGGNRCSKIRNYINILIVFILSGMWHGPTINFFLWGLFNGILLIIEKMTKYKPKNNLFIILNYLVVSCLWIFFLYPNISTMTNTLTNFLKFSYNLNFLNIMSISNYLVLFGSIIFLIIIDYLKYKGKIFKFKYRHTDYIFLIIFILTIILLGSYGIGFDKIDFIYNRF